MELNELDSLLKSILETDSPAPPAAPATVQPAQPEAPQAPAQVEEVVINTPVEAPVTQLSNDAFTDTKARDAVKIPMPTFTTDDIADTMDIRNFATLVRLETRRWHAKVKDRQASRDAASMNSASPEAFETRKRLLAGADEKLKAIHKAIDEARASHYTLTLPWTSRGTDDLGRRTGPRLLPNTLFFEYTKAMAEAKAKVVAAVADFEPAYPDLIEKARVQLGKRFDQSEYPLASSIGEHFGLEFDFAPVPKGDDFKGLPQQQIDALANSINGKAKKMIENAMQDVWERLYKAVTHMRDRLASPDKSFHYTMTENVAELARLLPHLNVINDARINNIHDALLKHVVPHSAEALREHPELRRTVAAHVSDIATEMEKHHV